MIWESGLGTGKAARLRQSQLTETEIKHFEKIKQKKKRKHHPEMYMGHMFEMLIIPKRAHTHHIVAGFSFSRLDIFGCQT